MLALIKFRNWKMVCLTNVMIKNLLIIIIIIIFVQIIKQLITTGIYLDSQWYIVIKITLKKANN